MYEVQPPAIDLGEIGNQSRLPDVTLADVRTQAREQLIVRQIPSLFMRCF